MNLYWLVLLYFGAAFILALVLVLLIFGIAQLIDK